MRLFLGEYDHILDDRGRIMLPRKIRTELTGEQIVVSKGFDACIFGYDMNSWENEAGKQLVNSVTDKDSRNMRRYLFSAAEKAEIDKLGRVVLPAHLKEYAGIEKDVIVIGAGDHFELWEPKRWEAYQLSMKES
jgi:MraZ protein